MAASDMNEFDEFLSIFGIIFSLSFADLTERKFSLSLFRSISTYRSCDSLFPSKNFHARDRVFSATDRRDLIARRCKKIHLADRCSDPKRCEVVVRSWLFRALLPPVVGESLLEHTLGGLPDLDDQEGPSAELDEHLDPLSGRLPELRQGDQVDVAEDGADHQQHHAHGRQQPRVSHESTAPGVLLALIREHGQAQKRTRQRARDVRCPADPAATQQRRDGQRRDVGAGEQQHGAETPAGVAQLAVALKRTRSTRMPHDRLSVFSKGKKLEQEVPKNYMHNSNKLFKKL